MVWLRKRLPCAGPQGSVHSRTDTGTARPTGFPGRGRAAPKRGVSGQVKRTLVVGLEATCHFLDTLPRRELGNWVRGSYGCRWLRLSWFAWRLDNRWSTGVWSTHDTSTSAAGEGNATISGNSSPFIGGAW